ncbi:MAG: dihydrolipoyl dehydrogenase [Dehalococcoidales bacterium]|nr:dihydrolipoyl dehydrogenase [Dehalococcoidales bacterium]
MKEYEVVVIGSGCGMNIVNAALARGTEAALIDKGPLGGTCPNLGCIPSKMLIFAADRISEIQEAKKLGITAEIKNVDFKFIMEHMRKSVREEQVHMRKELKYIEKLDFYEGEGHFTDENTLEVNGEQIKGKKIFIATGSRPLIPALTGLDTAGYLTNETVLQLKERPESLIIIGGGYIAVEYGHFFAAVGTKVTILEMADRLVNAEEPEISQLLEKELGKRMYVNTRVKVEEIKKTGSDAVVVVSDIKSGDKKEYTAQRVLLATGRVPNTDRLAVEKAGIETNEKGYIRTNEFLETTRKNIYAVGDVNGEQLFTHAANRESVIAAHNALHGSKMKMDYSATPRAVFSRPQIASVGMREEEAKKTHKILVGRAKYSDVAQGEAMMDESSFAKAIVEVDSEKILGFHVIGPYAPIIIQEVVNVMAAGGNVNHLEAGMHIHPSITELVMKTMDNLEEP